MKTKKHVSILILEKIEFKVKILIGPENFLFINCSINYKYVAVTFVSTHIHKHFLYSSNFKKCKLMKMKVDILKIYNHSVSLIMSIKKAPIK